MIQNVEGQNEMQEEKMCFFKKVAGMFKAFFSALTEVYELFTSNYKNTKLGPYVSVCVCIAIIAARTLYENLSRTAILAVLLWVLICVLASLAIYGAEQIIKFLFRHNVIFFFYWVLLFFILKNGLYSGCIKSVRTPSLILMGIFSFLIPVFVAGLVAILKNKKKSALLYSLTGVSGVLILIIAIFLGTEGFEKTKVQEYLALGEIEEISVIAAEDLEEIDGITSGPYEVKMLEYGTSDIESREVDLSTYATDSDGIEGFYRQKFLDMDLEHAMVQGLVWYPEEMTNCPILFVIHGNHTTNETSHDGYEYLGEYLASYGYMVVSVDENILNTLSGENDARAIFLLEHMEQLHEYCLDEENPLYQKGDYGKIAIAGHSRGGESVALAYLFNNLTNYTENGVRKLNFDFDIQSIIAIAPSVNQFTPADHPVEIKDVNYLLLQGANDQDIYGYMGMTQYENIIFSGEKDCFKSSIYIANANHGQFNSKWGRYDLQFPSSIWLNVKNLLAEEEQKQIAKTMIKVFLDDTLQNDKTHHGIFTDYRSYTEILPDTLYVTSYQSSNQLLISDFEEDADLTTGSLENSKVKVNHVGIWSEQTENYTNLGMSKKNRQNHILKIKWTDKEDPYVEFKFPKLNLENKILSFSIADADLRAVEEETYELLVCEIRLMDEKGEKVSCTTEDYATLYPPIPTRLGKMQYLTKDMEYKIAMQTVRIPIEDFMDESNLIDFSSIVEIEIHILNRESGEIYFDKLAIE